MKYVWGPPFESGKDSVLVVVLCFFFADVADPVQWFSPLSNSTTVPSTLTSQSGTASLPATKLKFSPLLVVLLLVDNVRTARSLSFFAATTPHSPSSSSYLILAHLALAMVSSRAQPQRCPLLLHRQMPQTCPRLGSSVSCRLFCLQDFCSSQHEQHCS